MGCGCKGFQSLNGGGLGETLTPGVPVETQGSSQAAMGVLGWAAAIAGLLLVGSFVMRPKRG